MQARSNMACSGIPNKATQRGFTLLELLVALAIFAIMSLITYRGVSMLIDTRSAVVSETQYWRELTLAFERLENDLSQLAPRPWRDQQGQWQAPLRSTEQGLEFIRFDANRAPLHGVYECSEQALRLKLYPQADLASGDQAAVHVLLKPLSQCEFAFMDKNNQWQSSWREAETRPRAIRIRLAIAQRQGVYERVFLIP
ncbi:type II secretion system minor pseudopilin GspJ [Chitinibacter sp. SCUT-21]|uniref:type II secretion system minor pseudopilin GspJ n=1 Tax=Chitinibacter sp. SCUT-21 TaxID=2970891 RepID=UPI0035A6A78F